MKLQDTNQTTRKKRNLNLSALEKTLEILHKYKVTTYQADGISISISPETYRDSLLSQQVSSQNTPEMRSLSKSDIEWVHSMSCD